MYYTYVLRSQKDGKKYVGITLNLNRRLAEHNKGKNPSTKFRRPLCFIYAECLSSREDARVREKYLKSAAGRKYIKKII